MPLWNIYHPPNTFTSTPDKTALANAITEIYVKAGLPRFYVNVLFQPIQPESFFIGGVARPSPNTDANKPGRDSTVPMIRIRIEHLARQMPNMAHKLRFMDAVDAALKPFIGDKGYDWEYSVEEVDRDLWKVNGMVPPMPGTEAEKEWAEGNVAVPFEAEKGGLAGKL
ncbi:hypothetical protein J4E91_010912 [Alternaria rosae]|nr:hypothetical protein J4E91_010912 [Alternaria rosae]